MAINSAVSGAAADNGSYAAGDVILAVFIAVTILINTIAVTALYLGRRTRNLLLEGLVDMYRDNEVKKYYSEELLSNYGTPLSALCRGDHSLGADSYPDSPHHPFCLIKC